jgi:hypothetical protein
MIISIDAERGLIKLKYPFMIKKNPEKTRNRRNVPQQRLYTKPITNTVLNREKFKTISSKVRTETKVFLLSILII